MFRLTLFFLALAGLFLATPVQNAYKIVYMDKYGIHYSDSPPNNITRRHENGHGHWGKPKPKPKPKPKGHHVGWPKPHDHDHDHKKHHGHHHDDPIIQIIEENEAEAFCSTFLHIVPFAATTTKVSTKTTSAVEATDTITSTSISSPGVTTVTATASTTTTTNDVVATTTITDVITTTSTSITTSTSTTTQFTAPNGLERRGGGDGGGGCKIPDWLPFPSSLVSSACNEIVTRKTETLSATTTSIIPLTTTTTTTTTTTLPQITDTVTSTFTSTDVVTVTDSTTTFTTTATTTTTTANAVATQCAEFANIDGGGVSTSGTLTPHTEIQSPEACCEFCWTGETGCGLWFFFPGFGCFVVQNASGPNPSTQCPTGDGEYVVINASGFDGDVGGAGPCAGSLVN